MELSSILLFFFSALGVFNGFLVALWFLLKNPSGKELRVADRLLAALILMLSIRIGKSVFFYFDPHLAKEILQLGLTACFFIGPLTYFYTGAMSNALKRTFPTHLATLIILPVAVGAMFPYSEFPELWGLIFKSIYVIWLAYLALSVYVSRQHWRGLINGQEYDKRVVMINIASGVIWLVYYTSSYTSYIAGALIYSFIIYVSFVSGFYSQFRPHRRVTKKIESYKAQPLLDKLNFLMEEEEVYKNGTTNLPLLAKRLGITTACLSQLLNDNLKISFSQFINQYRVEAAKKILCGSKNYKLEILADEVGFNSMSTFYSAFKAHTGVTPAKYRLQNKPAQTMDSEIINQ